MKHNKIITGSPDFSSSSSLARSSFILDIFKPLCGKPWNNQRWPLKKNGEVPFVSSQRGVRCISTTPVVNVLPWERLAWKSLPLLLTSLLCDQWVLPPTQLSPLLRCSLQQNHPLLLHFSFPKLGLQSSDQGPLAPSPSSTFTSCSQSSWGICPMYGN